ncbi:hypothetical protein AB205_0152100 [Aquarana catesbeiana]|uniref:Uncharacterized protein n=1 Tax=Aquarana catesbeiana TaxID=8400 RepID=A0A2G9SJD3_AQUCT|nr:hypothetical protein AB205_0152100 [Aquarana catesbeiana]
MNYIFTCLFKKKKSYEIYTSLVVKWLVDVSCYKQKKKSYILLHFQFVFFFKLCSKIFLFPVHFLWFQIYYFCFLIILIRCIFCSCVGYFPFLLLGVAKITQSLQICDPLLFLAKKYRDLDHMDFFFFHGALGEANSPEEQRLVTSLLG